jgi:hypothetical protein
MEMYMHEITPEMVSTVEDLVRRNFENATPDEIRTYGEWTAIIAVQQDEIEQQRRERRERTAREQERNEQQANAAINAMKALEELAKAKLKAVENG